jgi:hypothetical protein
MTTITITIPESVDSNMLECLEETYRSILNLFKEKETTFKMSSSKEPINKIDEHYTSLCCFNRINYKPKITNEHYIPDKLKTNTEIYDYKVCVLPKGHKGKCQGDYNNIYKNDIYGNKLKESIRLAIFSTPGNDDYVFKNRASRLYPYYLTQEQEKEIRDKNQKKKCAIPKKDRSTPHFMAQAYIDWITYIINVYGIDKCIDTNEYRTSGIKHLLNQHKQFLINYYDNYNRQIFDKNGYTMCVVMRKTFNLSDILDITRDMRKDYKDTDIQLGHNIARSDKYITIKGCNLLPMTRQGNLCIGENIFTEQKWIDYFYNISIKYSHTYAAQQEELELLRKVST